METRRATLVDAFTTEPLAGNVAGVVPNADGLAADQMQRLATELGASETAFRFTAAGETDTDAAASTPTDRLRYFTPTTEVDLCGHATIATYASLYADGDIDAGERTLRTNVGDLTVTVDDDGTVWMRQQPPTVSLLPDATDDTGSTDADGSGVTDPDTREIDAERLGAALGIDPAALRDVGADLPIAVASTGLPWLVVPVNFLERLGEATPDTAALTAISEAYDVAGVYAFTFDTLEAESTLHGRAFAPAVGITEDPVTGTASGAMGGYLQAVEAFDGEFPDELRFEQGHFCDRPGYVRVRIGDTDEGGVTIGGEGIVSLDGTIRLPAPDDDEIIEA